MDRALHQHDGNNGRAHMATETGEESMSKQQQLELDATLRQGQFDLGADFPTLRAGFSPADARAVVIRLARRELPTIATPISFRAR
jgi:hypothetical protein